MKDSTREATGKRLSTTIVLAAIALACVACGSTNTRERSRTTDDFEPLSSQALESRIEYLEGEYVDVLRRFYGGREHGYVWVSEAGFSSLGRSLLEFLVADPRSPSMLFLERHLLEIERVAEPAFEDPAAAPELRAERLAELEIAMSRAALRYADYVSGGEVRPRSVSEQWFLKDGNPDLAAYLGEVVDGEDIGTALLTLAEDHDGYRGLRAAYEHYGTLLEQGGWPTIAEGDTLELGATGARVATLRRRLQITGDLDGSTTSSRFDRSTTSARFDSSLEAALKKFQRRHGLEPDGVVGERTRVALNVSVEERLRTLELNLERRRWMPASFGDEYVLVNIPAFQLTAYRNGERALAMRVVVGTPVQATPVFADEIELVVFRPYWNVPVSIAVDEIWPNVEADPSYLAERSYEIVRWGEESPLESYDLEMIRSGRAYIRQRPGPGNALGLVKFLFPNNHNVYLHDTPADHLFAESRRAFSHGCIRLESPADFAAYVLDGSWSREEIRDALAGSERHAVRVDPKIPVTITYMTAWTDSDGTVHFRDDIYGLDEPLATEIAERKERDAKWRPFLAQRMRRFLDAESVG